MYFIASSSCGCRLRSLDELRTGKSTLGALRGILHLKDGPDAGLRHAGDLRAVRWQPRRAAGRHQGRAAAEDDVAPARPDDVALVDVQEPRELVRVGGVGARLAE